MARIGQQRLPMRGQRYRAGIAQEQCRLQLFLKLLYLHGNGRGRPEHHFRSGGEISVSAIATKVLNMSLSSNGSGWRKVTVMARTFKYFDL